MSEIIYTIYKIINLLNNKIYIGFTSYSIQERFKNHIRSANKNNGFLLHTAIRKYKPENFTIESIYESTDRDHTLKVMEPYFIKEHNSNNSKIGYNMTSGGEGTIGYKHNKNSKLKISKASKNRICSEETKTKMSNIHKGKNNSMYNKHHSIETKQKISKATAAEKNHNYGKMFSNETKIRMSLAQIGDKNHNYGKKHTEEENMKNRESNLGEKNGMYGKKHSIETKRKISEALKNRYKN